jgi:hypothetical protein
LQQKLAEVKDSMTVNKMLLAQYTWMEQDIISIKGEQKKEELYNVQLGPDGSRKKRLSTLVPFPTISGGAEVCVHGLLRIPTGD